MPKMTAAQKERIVNMAMRWYRQQLKFPVSQLNDPYYKSLLFKACAAAHKGKK